MYDNLSDVLQWDEHKSRLPKMARHCQTVTVSMATSTASKSFSVHGAVFTVRQCRLHGCCQIRKACFPNYNDYWLLVRPI